MEKMTKMNKYQICEYSAEVRKNDFIDNSFMLQDSLWDNREPDDVHIYDTKEEACRAWEELNVPLMTHDYGRYVTIEFYEMDELVYTDDDEEPDEVLSMEQSDFTAVVFEFNNREQVEAMEALYRKIGLNSEDALQDVMNGEYETIEAEDADGWDQTYYVVKRLDCFGAIQEDGDEIITDAETFDRMFGTPDAFVLKEARAAASLTQQNVSDEIGIPKRTYESWEMGERKPAPWVLKLVVAEIGRVEKAKREHEEAIVAAGKILYEALEKDGYSRYILRDYRFDHLTEHDINGRRILHYFYEDGEGAIDMDTMEVITDEEDLAALKIY